MTEDINTNPSILWAQDRNHIFITFEVENIKQQNIIFENNSIIFEANSEEINYNVIINLFGEIETDKCNWNIKQNCVKLVLKKVKNIFWNRLTTQKQNNIKIDWSKWILEDESESEEENEMISNFNDFKKNIPSEILEKDFQELFSPDESISDDTDDTDDIDENIDINVNDNDINVNDINDTSYDASGELSSSLVENIDKLNLDDELENSKNVGEGFSFEELNSSNLELDELNLEENNINK